MRVETTDESPGLFNVDATYVLHLTNNGRLESVQTQLKLHRPSTIVHIVHNPGSLPPAADIVAAYQWIFRHAKEQAYGNVLVLEDDFTWGRVSVDDAAQVNTFLKGNADRSLVYHLGCLPAVMLPMNGAYLTLGCGTHASVYTKPCRDWVLKYHHRIRDWDMFLFFHFFRYAYGRPLCYQLYGRTANSDQWLQFCGLTPLLRLGARMLLLDRRAEPGYWLCYTGAKCAPLAGVAALVAAVVWGPKAFRMVKKLIDSNPNPNPTLKP
jgi:hypothetical protein